MYTINSYLLTVLDTNNFLQAVTFIPYFLSLQFMWIDRHPVPVVLQLLAYFLAAKGINFSFSPFSVIKETWRCERPLGDSDKKKKTDVPNYWKASRLRFQTRTKIFCSCFKYVTKFFMQVSFYFPLFCEIFGKVWELK